MPSISLDGPRFEVLKDGFILGQFKHLKFAFMFADILDGGVWKPENPKQTRELKLPEWKFIVLRL